MDRTCFVFSVSTKQLSSLSILVRELKDYPETLKKSSQHLKVLQRKIDSISDMSHDELKEVFSYLAEHCVLFSAKESSRLSDLFSEFFLILFIIVNNFNFLACVSMPFKISLLKTHICFPRTKNNKYQDL